MSYRGDLDAAMQRIAALERQLEAAGDPRESPLVARLTAERDAIEQQLQQLRGELSRVESERAQRGQEVRSLQHRLGALEQQLAAMRKVQAPAGPGLVSVIEHNRRLPPPSRITREQGAGVLCPRCLELGDEVELRLGPNQWKDYGYGDVRCPVCLLHDWKKYG